MSRKLRSLLLAAAFLPMCTGCGEQAAQKMDEAKQAASDAAMSAGESMKDAAGAMSDAAEEAGKQLGEGFSAAADKAKAALEGIDGGGELLGKIQDFFRSTKETLQGVTDSETAKAAESKLGELGAEADRLSEMAAKLPAEARSAIAGLLEQGVEQLRQLVDKVAAIPGVGSSLKPKLDELVDRLDAFAKELSAAP